jgi:hypothetical protein
VTRSPLTDPRPDTEGPDARHRSEGRLHRPAAVLTGAITAGALALAGFAAMSPGATLDGDKVGTTLSQAGPEVGTEAVQELDRAAGVLRSGQDAERAERLQQARKDLKGSAAAAADASKAVKKRSEQIEAERKQAEQAAAEQRAAEQAAAEEQAAEQAAAEEQAAEERAAAEQAAPEQAASRSEERAPAPEQAPVASGDPRSIARSMLGSYGWGGDQFGCLDSLWQRESNWNPYAQNPSSGAYGIPQSLPGGKMASAGADWQTNPATQIRWGLGYISQVYGSPCGAWAHSQSVGWY